MTPEQARRTISELIALVGTSDVVDLEITDSDLHLRLHRPKGKPSPTHTAEGQAVSAPEQAPRAEPRAVRSPLVGRFYYAREIDLDPLVRVGDAITAGQVVGIIEAMSLFSDVESDVAGRVARILVENGERVEYGQPLMELE